MSRYDDLDHLIQELEMEKRYREGIEMANSDLEKNIEDLESYLRDLDDVSIRAEENEWKVRFEAQTALNIQLSDQKGWLESELAENRWKIHTGSYPDAMNFNLDLLTELELIRLVKHMERMRNDCYTTLRDAEYKIDKEVKEYHHFDEMRRCYKSDLKHATQTVERMKMEELLERRGGTPPLYSPSYIRWLDSQSLDEDSSPKPSKSKSRSKSLSKDGRSSSKSPGRSKSRSKSKRRDETEDPTTDQGADDGGTDQGGDDDDKKGASGGESGKDGDKK